MKKKHGFCTADVRLFSIFRQRVRRVSNCSGRSYLPYSFPSQSPRRRDGLCVLLRLVFINNHQYLHVQWGNRVDFHFFY